MVFCPQCGKEFHNTPTLVWDHCPWCGADYGQAQRVGPVPTLDPRAVTPGPSTPSFYTQPSPAHSHRVYHIVIAVLLVVIAVLTVITIPLALPRSFSPILPLNLGSVKERLTSPYWSGYKTRYSPGSIVYASANWTIPVLNCDVSTGLQSAVSIIGIGGVVNVADAFPRAGIEYDCNYNSPTYQVVYGWSPQVRYSISSVQANPGDKIGVVVQWTQNTFVTTIDDPSQGWLVERENSTIPGAPRADAEWMIAATGSNGVSTPLANFGQIAYTACYASSGGPPVPMGSFSLVQDTMVSRSGVGDRARPAYGTDGTSFSIQWITYI